MATIKRLRAYFWAIDPGYFNLKHALKTILAILLSLLLVRNESTLTQVIAVIISGFSMQGLVAKTFSSRIIQLIIFDAVYFAVLLLGVAVRDSGNWTALTLVSLGFAVNYVRRFGLENSRAPMMVWILCFLVTILPFSITVRTGALAYGAGLGFFVSALVELFIFPQNDAHLFVNNSNQFFKTLAYGLQEMRRYVLVSSEQVNFENLSFVIIKTTLERMLESNQAIQGDKVFDDEQERIDHILMQQYALLNAYSLLIDVYRSLWVKNYHLSRSSVLALSYLSNQFSLLFMTTKLSKNYGVTMAYSPTLLPDLAKKLGKLSLVDSTPIMALLNFKLGFDLFKHHEKKLLRGIDAT